MKEHSARLLQVAFTVISAAFLTTYATPKDKYLPLPPQVTTAKTVYIDNQTGVSKVGDECYQAIQKWGRLQVLQDRKRADLILLLSYSAWHSATTGSVDENGNSKTTSNATYAASEGYTYMTLIDPKTEESLWSDSKQRGSWYAGSDSAITRLVDELRKRMK